MSGSQIGSSNISGLAAGGAPQYQLNSAGNNNSIMGGPLGLPPQPLQPPTHQASIASSNGIGTSALLQLDCSNLAMASARSLQSNFDSNLTRVGSSVRVPDLNTYKNDLDNAHFV